MKTSIDRDSESVTSVLVESAESFEDVAEIAKGTGPLGWLDTAEQRAIEVLSAQGLPTEDMCYLSDGTGTGAWESMPPMLMAKVPYTEKLALLAEIAKRRKWRIVYASDLPALITTRRHRPEWYAANIIVYASRARKAVSAGDALGALEAGMQAADAIRAMGFKIGGIEAAAIQGHRVNLGRAASHEARRENVAELTASRDAEMRRLDAAFVSKHPKLSSKRQRAAGIERDLRAFVDKHNKSHPDSPLRTISAEEIRKKLPAIN